MATITVNEKSTSVITGTYKDEDLDPIGSDRMECILCTIHLKADETQTHRSTDDLLNDEAFTLDEDGVYEHNLKPYETELFDLDTSRGSTEKHAIALRFCWDSERSGSLTSPFTVEEDSAVVTVDFANHGLSVRDTIFFHPAAEIGGLDLGGVFVVRSVIDADTFTIEAKSEATADASAAGGTTRYWINPFTDAATIGLTIKAIDPQ